MKTLNYSPSILIFLLANSAVGQILAITTQPDLAFILRRIAGDEAKVESLTNGYQDLHLLRVRPSTLIKVRRADLFCQLGLDAEHAWVPPLLRKARNKKIRPGSIGFVNCSIGIKPLASVGGKSRSEAADLHPRGNPHYNLDPEQMRQAARNILAALEKLRPASAPKFRKNESAWEKELDHHLVAWKKRLLPFKGAGFIEYHSAWAYFAHRFDLRIAARMEPRPGLAPTPGHLAQIIALGRTQKIGLVLSHPAKADLAKKVAREIGAKAVALPISSTLHGPNSGYFAFMDHVVEIFATNLEKRQ